MSPTEYIKKCAKNAVPLDLENIFLAINDLEVYNIMQQSNFK